MVSLTRSALRGCVLALLVACGSSVSPPADSEDAARSDLPDGGVAADAGCGLSFDEALEAYAPERVCQATVYDLVTGYCTHWVACSSLY